ncbi:hypothetical protein ACFWIX_13180 [Pseudarthrobacter sp. NPDC058362]|uniref:hypothetical protein n=1 Tax=Pseudarthrobacter sp. NPDC058362 TaxID=3346458 RepID=UPI00365E4641
MRNIFTKSLAVGAVSGLMLVGGAGLASADAGDSTEAHVDEVAQVTDNSITDSGNLSLDNILNGGLVDTGDVASNNNVLNGIDADLSDVLSGNLSGNDTDVDVDPDVDSNVDADTSADSTTDGGQDDEGLLGGLLG